MKNREISEIAISRLSHFPTFPLSHFPTFREFFPPAPQPRISAAEGKKLGDCGIVGLWDCGEIAISEISGFSVDVLI